VRLHLDLRPYRCPLHSPLHTCHGSWTHREGIILRLRDEEGNFGWGEVAPLDWFGTESQQTAWEYCQALTDHCTEAAIASIPDNLPACQFGLEAALETLSHPFSADFGDHRYGLGHLSFLLPAGQAALTAWHQPWQTGYRTFKWKIGTAALADELTWFNQLVRQLPPIAQLRLDANGGLDWDEACQWLEQCDRILHSPELHGQVEFLEQPLPTGQETATLALQRRFQTTIALDESVASVCALEALWQQGWRGIFVVKPAIAGSPRRLRRFCRLHPDAQIVWSSALETLVARWFILRHLLPGVPQTQRVLGFGTEQWFSGQWQQHTGITDLWQSL
jgi:O-succinylbenzoate synthase